MIKHFLLTCLALLIATPSLAAEFVSPVGFDPTPENKRAVVEYIKSNVKSDYTKIGMASESVLRMMEHENLDAFKRLLSAKDKKLLLRVIDQYCSIGMCNYTTILMMYNEEVRAKKQSLQW